MNKKRDLTIIAFIYVLAYILGYVCCLNIENIMLKMFVFDVAATIVTFVFSIIFVNSSVYDAYWSLTPMLMSVWLFVTSKAFSFWQIIFLIVFNIWSIRLTINWCVVFTDFSYEDWRYRKFREETPKIFWPIVNFFGIHMMPTLVVFAGMLPLFEIAKNKMDALAIPGMLVILFGVCLEYFADRQMHAFLNETKEKICCRNGLWKYSRHPNYLGEITVWVGVYLTMLPYSLDKWIYGAGALGVCILFNVVSIPLMEKRQKNRRSDFDDYKKQTSRLLLWKK